MSVRPLSAAAVPTTSPDPELRSVPFAAFAVFAAGHAVLALVMRAVPSVGTVHAVACLGVGVFVAARRPIREVAFVVAYIVGAEVLWRMTSAGVFWEYGKYAVSAVVLIALSRVHAPRNRGLAITYLVVLLPSVLLTVMNEPFDRARQEVSFNLSGPLCLMLCVLLFSNVRLRDDDLRTTMLMLIAPVLGICTIAYHSTVSATDLTFFGDSNTVTSGGFDPNQVSAMLGLGLLFALLLVLERRVSLPLRIALAVLAVAFAAQAALTFSRGGLGLALASAFAAMFYLVRDRRARITLVVLGALLFSVGKYMVVPRLEEFTSGKLGERYTDLNTSNRAAIASDDLQIFANNPVLGVGPGAATKLREELGHVGVAHTEFTRLLAEHGILGALATLLLFALAIRTVTRARTLQARAFVVAMVVWVTLFLLINAMRLAAPSFLFGLACAVSHASLPARQRLAGARPIHVRP